METCLICLKEFKRLGHHLNKCHNINSEQYYFTYINNYNKCKICGSKTKFRNISYGFEYFCSKECRAKNVSNKMTGNVYNKGRKQSKETIEKRVRNTDQNKKENTRKETMINKYGVVNCSQIDGMQEKIKQTHIKNNIPYGKKVTSETAYKIAETKRKNGTLKHTQKAKDKMSISIKASYDKRYLENPNYKKKITAKGCSGKSGNFNGIYYRSSYELKFLQICQNNNIKVISAENSKFSTKYISSKDERFHTYHPDFYLPDYNMIIEIKSDYFLEKDSDVINDKLLALDKPFMLLTEEELFDKNETFIKDLIKYC